MPSVLQAASSDPEHLARRYDGDIGMYNKMRNRISGRGGQRADRNADGRRVANSSAWKARPKKRKTRSWMLPIMTWRASPRAAVLQAPSPPARGTLGYGVGGCRTRGVLFFVVVRRCTRRPVGRVSTARARAPSTSLHKTSSQHLAKVSRQENDHPRRVPV